MTPATTDDVQDRGARSGRGGGRARDHDLARAVAVLSAVGAALAGAEPTGTPIVDPVLAGAFAAVVTLAAGRARRQPVMVLPLGAIAVATGWAFVFAFGASGAALVGAVRRRRVRVWGALTAALSLQALLRAPDIVFHGFPSLVTAVAVTPALVSGYRMCRSQERRRIRRIVAITGGIVALVGLAYGGLVLSVISDVDRATADARHGLSATRRGETDTARSDFQSAADSFRRADSVLNAWWAAPARAVPVLAQHARSLGNAADEGHRLSVTAGDTVEAADYQQLRYASGRFDLNRIRSVAEPLDRSLTSIDAARRSLSRSDSDWLIPPLADGLDDLDIELADAQAEAELADQAVAVAPALLGADGPRRYVVAFVTPAEVRGAGGFMGSWAEVTADSGELRLTDSGPVTDLMPEFNEPPLTITGPPEYVARYGRFSPDRYIGDFAFSPHFPHDAQVMSELYPQATGRPLDGVISIDPVALAALLTFTGPLDVEGFDRTLTAENAADFLLRDNYALFPDSDEQNEALARLVETTFDELTTGDLPGPRDLADVLSRPTREGHLRLWSPQADEQALFARLGATGAFPAPREGHDFFAVSSQNTGNNKIDVFQSRDLTYDVDVASDGSLQATATVTIRNDAPVDGSVPDYVVGNNRGDPPGTNLMLVSVHTPHALEGATLDGRSVGMEAQTEAGYPVYSRYVSVPPGGEVTLELRLRGRLPTDAEYVLDLAPHPMANPDRLTVRVSRSGQDSAVLPPAETEGRRSILPGARSS